MIQAFMILAPSSLCHGRALRLKESRAVALNRINSPLNRSDFICGLSSRVYGSVVMLSWLDSGLLNNRSESCVCVTHLTSKGGREGLLGVRLVFEDDLVVVSGVLDVMVD